MITMNYWSCLVHSIHDYVYDDWTFNACEVSAIVYQMSEYFVTRKTFEAQGGISSIVFLLP